MTHLIDVANGNTNTKIIALLSLLREQLNTIEERLNRLECSCPDGQIDIDLSEWYS